MLERPQEIDLRIYDLLGREVRMLARGRRAAGEQRVRLDGEGLASGVYFARLQTEQGWASRKLLLLR